MGHGDSICFADANFPSETCLRTPGTSGPITIRADGQEVAPLLRAVSKLFPLDSYTDCPVKMMAPVPGDDLDPSIETRFGEAVEAEQVKPDMGRAAGGEYNRKMFRFATLRVGGIYAWLDDSDPKVSKASKRAWF